jgi:hypothetical protein
MLFHRVQGLRILIARAWTRYLSWGRRGSCAQCPGRTTDHAGRAAEDAAEHGANRSREGSRCHKFTMTHGSIPDPRDGIRDGKAVS